MPLPMESELFYGLDLSKEQKEYVDSIFDNQMTIVNAGSGTGKTTLAVGAARILGKPLIYTFSPVEEDVLGFEPGTTEDKERNYRSPLLNALKAINVDPRFAIYSEKNPDHINKETWIQAKSHTYFRGTNIKDSILIIDEAQNFTRSELKKVLTRVHDSTTVIMIGHDQQCDLDDVSQSGFVPYLKHFEYEPYVKICELTHNYRGILAQRADVLEIARR